jgi:hypothetical protein
VGVYGKSLQKKSIQSLRNKESPGTGAAMFLCYCRLTSQVPSLGVTNDSSQRAVVMAVTDSRDTHDTGAGHHATLRRLPVIPAPALRVLLPFPFALLSEPSSSSFSPEDSDPAVLEDT